MKSCFKTIISKTGNATKLRDRLQSPLFDATRKKAKCSTSLQCAVLVHWTVVPAGRSCWWGRGHLLSTQRGETDHDSVSAAKRYLCFGLAVQNHLQQLPLLQQQTAEQGSGFDCPSQPPTTLLPPGIFEDSAVGLC